MKMLKYSLIILLFFLQCGQSSHFLNSLSAKESPDQISGASVIKSPDPVAPLAEPQIQLYSGKWKDPAVSKNFKTGKLEFEKKNYKRASEFFLKFIKEDPDNKEVPQASFLVSKSYFRLQDYDNALKILEDFLASKPGSLWEARTHVELANLFKVMPYYGYRREGKVFYNAEHREGEYAYLWQEHRERVVRELEDARWIYRAIIKANSTSSSEKEDSAKEGIANNFNLAENLMQQGGNIYDPYPPAEDIVPPSLNEVYDAKWQERKKILYLLDEVFLLNKGRSDRHPEAHSLYMRANFLNLYPEAPTREWLKDQEAKAKEYDEKKKPEETPYKTPLYFPSPDFDPLSILERVLKEYPSDSDEDLYFLSTGRIHEGRGNFVEAEKIYEKFIARFPKSRYVNDAKSFLQAIKMPSLSLSSATVYYYRMPVEWVLTTRNISEIQFSAYTVDAFEVLTKSGHMNDPKTSFLNLEQNFGKLKEAKKHFGKKVAEWEIKTNDRGEHEYISSRTSVPVKEPGTYFVHAEANGIEYLFFLIVTDVIIVEKSERNKMFYFVTEAKTGKPLKDFDLKVKEVYGYSGWWYRETVKISEGRTDESGRFTYNLTTGDKIHSNRVEIIGRTGKSIALLPQSWGRYYRPYVEPDTYRIFTYTDRPVYRTGDLVKFKHIVRAYRNGKNENAPDLEARITVVNPKGETVFDKTAKTDSFGTVYGEVKIDAEAPLGVYSAHLSIIGAKWGSYQSSGSQFRVEEYKKPEFEVKVVPSASELRPGESAEAVIEARYYFGSPVENAKVKYTITRNIFYQWHARPTKWDWLFGEGYEIAYERPYAGGAEFISDGEGKTDAEGRMKIKLPPCSKDTQYDYQYFIVAEVTDLSRRTINGSGSVTVSRDPFYLYIFTDQGFYQPDDNVKIEINALTPSNTPVSAAGTAEIFRLAYSAGEKPAEELVKKLDMSLDAEGRDFLEWKTNREGQYLIRIKARNQAKENSAAEVKKEMIITVAKEKFPQTAFRFNNITIMTEKRTYLRGEKIRALVGTPYNDATIWLTFEAGDEILKEMVIKPEQGSRIIEFEASENLSPNFFLRVVVVHDNMVLTMDREIFIPPGEEILDVSLKPDREDYRPGSKGTFTLKVKDYRGNPVKAQLSLAVFDSSVLYIQRETAGDIRSYYYGKRRYISLYMQHSGSIWNLYYYEDHNKYEQYETGGFPFGISYGYWGYFRGGGASYGWGEGGGGGFLDERMEMSKSETAAGNIMTAKRSMMQSLPAAAPAEARMKVTESLAMDSAGIAGAGEKDKNGDFAEAKAREYFPDTALFEPDVVTNEKGEAKVSITYPDSLTTWAVRAVTIDRGAKVGVAGGSVIVTKKLIARIETPRFLVEGDEVVLAAVLRNELKKDASVNIIVESEGDAVRIDGDAKKTVNLKPDSEQRIDFRGMALKEGEARITLKALSREESDILVKKVPVLPWGADRMAVSSAVLKDASKTLLIFDVPSERRIETTRLTLVLDPTIAGVMLNALPYLIAYPYGCVEQTMSRFLPAALVSRTLNDLGVKLEELPRLADKGTLGSPLSERLTVMSRDQYPVYNTETLKKFIRAGLKKLYGAQNSDGGFGWWHGMDSEIYMTAYVVMGLMEAYDAGVEIEADRIERGLSFLREKFGKTKKDIYLRVFAGYVLARGGKLKASELDEVFKNRDELTPYGKSLLALALYHAKDTERAGIIAENLTDLAWIDRENGTASFKSNPGYFWWWYEDRVETVAWALRAMLAIKPDSELSRMFAKWLVLNRQGNRWYSTKDTAMTIFALNKYMKQSKETEADYILKVKINDKILKTMHIDRKNVLLTSEVIILSGSEVPSGKMDIGLEMEGSGKLYAAAFLEYFTKEKKITGSGNEIFVKREYYKLTPVTGTKKTWQGEIKVRDYKKDLVKPGEEIKSGEMIEVKMIVEAKNDYEYLVFEDFKPAGFEPMELKSGYTCGHGLCSYMELRDEKTVFFVGNLLQGKQVFTYRARAEIPGIFKVIPHRGYAMYAPRVRAISDSDEITIESE
jgi:uncharacterized protein YfaS (alpha-2-macroglobulin family)/TolA-binding protein